MSKVDQESRRDFIKKAAVSAGAVGALAACGKPGEPQVRSEASATNDGSSGSPLTISGYAVDRVTALADGRAPVEGFDVTFREDRIGDLNTRVFNGSQTIEVTEIGLHPFMLAFANNGFRDFSLLPVFPLRLFRHKSIFIRSDRGIGAPEDLRGKVIATPGYSSTSLTWIRGMLQHEYGIRPEDVRWVVSSKASDAESGKTSDQENVFPEGLEIERGPAGVDESDLLVSGQADALFHAAEPRAYVDGNPIVGRLFPDYRRTERAYFAKTGIFPIMHAVAVRNDLIERHPQLLKALFDAYSLAKRFVFEYLGKAAWYKTSLPWIGQEFDETRELMGDNYWPYGVEANRTTLESLFQYSYEQGLASRKLTIEDLFHPATLGFFEETS